MASGGRNNSSRPDEEPERDEGATPAALAVGAALALGAAAAWGISKWLGSSDPEPPHKGKKMVALGTSAETAWQPAHKGMKMEELGTVERSYQQPPTKTTDIRQHEFYDTHNTYYVFFHGDSIHTTVTSDPDIVSDWISKVQSTHNPIVGLDAEWRPDDNPFAGLDANPVATLQLCVGRSCLIFQLIHSPYIPSSLRNFLADPRYTFVGVEIERIDLRKLAEEYDLGWQTKAVDLRDWAAQIYGNELKKAGLKRLAKLVLGKEMEKDKTVSWSKWDNDSLTPEQVMYACLDAFVGYEIGRKLNASSARY